LPKKWLKLLDRKYGGPVKEVMLNEMPGESLLIVPITPTPKFQKEPAPK
jgi:hypothetical protein